MHPLSFFVTLIISLLFVHFLRNSMGKYHLQLGFLCQIFCSFFLRLGLCTTHKRLTFLTLSCNFKIFIYLDIV